MKKPNAIIAGEPNSISSEIIFKSWKLKNKYNFKPFFVIGSYHLINLQKKKMKYKIKIKRINNSFKIKDLNKKFLPVLDIKYKQKSPFKKISTNSNRYIFNSFDKALELIKKRKIQSFINCPVSKETLFKNNHQGVTEYLSKKSGKKFEVMLIYNKKLSVCPITTHIPLKEVSKKIDKNKIVNKIKIINSFYIKILKKKPRFAVLGLNPHNYSSPKKSKENQIIKKAINTLKKSKIKITGPISPDTSFIINKKYKFDVIVGMYHDQVLTPFKALFKYNAINITLGLPYIRVSPDHGIAEDIVGKNIANPNSLIDSIKFFNNIN